MMKIICLIALLVVSISILAQDARPVYSKKDVKANQASVDSTGKTLMQKAKEVYLLAGQQPNAESAQRNAAGFMMSGDPVMAISFGDPGLFFTDAANNVVDCTIEKGGRVRGIYNVWSFDRGINYLKVGDSGELFAYGYDGILYILPRTDQITVNEAAIVEYDLGYPISDVQQVGPNSFRFINLNDWWGGTVFRLHSQINSVISTGVRSKNIGTADSPFNFYTRQVKDSKGNLYLMAAYEGGIAKYDPMKGKYSKVDDVEAPIAMALANDNLMFVLTGYYQDYDTGETTYGKVYRIELLNGLMIKKDVIFDQALAYYSPYGGIVASSDGKNVYFTSDSAIISVLSSNSCTNCGSMNGYVAGGYLSGIMSGTMLIGDLSFGKMPGQAPTSTVDATPVSTNTGRASSKAISARSAK